MASSATNARRGDATVIESEGIMHRVMRAHGATVVGNMPALLMADQRKVVESSVSMQSSRMAPITVSKALNDNHGDTIEVSTYHKLKDLPIMGSRKAKGEEEGFGKSKFKVRVDQYRKPVFTGSVMTQQRNQHNLTNLGVQAIEEYWMDITSEIVITHLAGMRGSFHNDDMILPPKEPRFGIDETPLDRYSEIFVNPVRPPTVDRHSFAGDATGIDTSNGATALTPNDTMNMESVRDILTLKESETNRMGLIELGAEDKKKAGIQAKGLWLMSHQQYADLRESDPRYFGELRAAAQNRSAGYMSDIFHDDCIFVQGYFIRPMPFPVQARANEVVPISNPDRDGTQTDAVVPSNVVAMHRSMILGAQALVLALAAKTNGMVYGVHKEKDDYDDKDSMCLGWIGGFKKTYQYSRSGRRYDVGVHIVDSAVSRAI